MIPFREIASSVSAREAAEAYGMRIYRSGRALCPWHDDRHPDLVFLDSGRCYCHACHQWGDSIDLTAKLFSLTNGEAAKKLMRDFSLDIHESVRPAARASPAQHRADRLKRLYEGWDMLCEIERGMSEALGEYDSDSAWDDPAFRAMLRTRADCSQRLDTILGNVRDEEAKERAARANGKKEAV